MSAGPKANLPGCRRESSANSAEQAAGDPPEAADRAAAPARSRLAHAREAAPNSWPSPARRRFPTGAPTSSVPVPVWNCSNVSLYDACARLERALRHREQLVVREQRQVLVGDLRKRAGFRRPCAPAPWRSTAATPGRSGSASGRRSRSPRRRTDRRNSRGSRSACRWAKDLRACADSTNRRIRRSAGTARARWIRYCACTCATFNAATRRSRLFASAISTSRCSRGSVRKSRQPISTAGNVRCPIRRSTTCTPRRSGTSAATGAAAARTPAGASNPAISVSDDQREGRDALALSPLPRSKSRSRFMASLHQPRARWVRTAPRPPRASS